MRLRGGPAGCASFFLRRCGSQLQLQCVKILHATYFPPQVNKSPPMWLSIEQRQQSGLIFSLAMLAIRLSWVVVQIKNATHRQWHQYIVVKNVCYYDTHTTNGCPLFVKRQKAESFFWLNTLSQDPTWVQGLHCQTPVIGLHSPNGPLFIKFVNPLLALLCLVTCWCGNLLNLVVATEVSTDLNETHENQCSRKKSPSRKLYFSP